MHPSLHVSQLPEQQNTVTIPSKQTSHRAKEALLLKVRVSSAASTLLCRLCCHAERWRGAWSLLRGTLTIREEAAPSYPACQSASIATSWRRWCPPTEVNLLIFQMRRQRIRDWCRVLQETRRSSLRLNPRWKGFLWWIIFLQHRAFFKNNNNNNNEKVVTVVVILVNLLHCRSYRLPGMAQWAITGATESQDTEIL